MGARPGSWSRERPDLGRGARSVRLNGEIAGCPGSCLRLRSITLKVQRDGRPVTLTVTADGTDSTVSHVGAALLAETADRLGLTAALSRELSGLRRRRSAQDPGRVVRDLAVMLADGGDALCDLRTLRDQPALFGAVASDATAWRVIDAIAEHELLDALRSARARVGSGRGSWARDRRAR